MEGLSESMRGEWSGDVDRNDGKLQQLFQQYQSRIEFIKTIGLNDRRDRSCILSDLLLEIESLKNNIMEFVSKSMIELLHVSVCDVGMFVPVGVFYMYMYTYNTYLLFICGLCVSQNCWKPMLSMKEVLKKDAY